MALVSFHRGASPNLSSLEQAEKTLGREFRRFGGSGKPFEVCEVVKADYCGIGKMNG
jgi:phosphoribulokinase